MKRMTPKALRRLENIQDNIQIAIYLPIIPGPENTAKNIGALHHATALLKKTMSANEIAPENQRVISKHITELERELTLPVSGKSLAIFITDFNQLLVYQVSFEVETAIYFMAPNVQLEPLKRYYRERSSYWVLVLSQKGCTLMRGKGHRLSPVQAADLSIDLKSALGLDETEPNDYLTTSKAIPYVGKQFIKMFSEGLSAANYFALNPVEENSKTLGHGYLSFYTWNNGQVKLLPQSRLFYTG
jgi:hypothetical protein